MRGFWRSFVRVVTFLLPYFDTIHVEVCVSSYADRKKYGLNMLRHPPEVMYFLKGVTRAAFRSPPVRSAKMSPPALI